MSDSHGEKIFWTIVGGIAGLGLLSLLAKKKCTRCGALNNRDDGRCWSCGAFRPSR